MTIIIDMGIWWIESIFVARTNILNGVAFTTSVNPSRGGRIVAVSTTVGVANNAANVTSSIRNADNSEITYGQVFANGIKLTIVNASGAAVDADLKALFIMRK